jgi:hypothetical protein
MRLFFIEDSLSVRSGLRTGDENFWSGKNAQIWRERDSQYCSQYTVQVNFFFIRLAALGASRAFLLFFTEENRERFLSVLLPRICLNRWSSVRRMLSDVVFCCFLLDPSDQCICIFSTFPYVCSVSSPFFNWCFFLLSYLFSQLRHFSTFSFSTFDLSEGPSESFSSRPRP